ncbi:MAG: TonB-dependent receptor [Rhodothalassiaceae bacterium]
MTQRLKTSTRSRRAFARHLVGSASAAALLLGLEASGVAAQTQGSSAGDGSQVVLEEITVTARRYAERVQDAPVAVSVMSDDFLEEQRIITVDDVIQQTPGATFIRFNKLQPEYNIRGINANAEGTSLEASVVTVIDNVPVSKDFMKNPAMYDMERVEILRGPQGTAFGRNAAAGLVHLITKRPTPDLEAEIQGGAGNDGLFETTGYLNLPLSDVLQTRIAYNFRHTDGHTKSVSTGKGLDGQENFSIRGSFLFTPTDRFSLYFKVDYNKDNDETPVRRSRDCTLPQIVAGGDPLRQQLGIPPSMPPWPITFFDPCDVWKTEISPGKFFIDREIVNLTGEITWEFADGYTLTSVTGYMDGDAQQRQEAHGTPVNILFQNGDQDAEIFTEEVRIDNHGTASPLRWLAGIFYLTDQHDRFDQNEFFANKPDGSRTLGGPRVPTFDTKISRNETDSIGLFGELSYDLTEQLTATVGVRWNRDEKDYEITHSGFGFGGPISQLQGCNFDPPFQFTCGDAANPVGFTTPVLVGDSWKDAMVRTSLEYRMNDEHMFYFLFSQGYKAGGFQPEPPNPTVALQPFDKENSNNYEIGWRGEFDRRFRVSLTGFRLKLNGLQLSQFIDVGGLGFFQAVSNAGGSRSIGVEFETTLLVTPDFRLSGSAALQDVQLTNTVVTLDTSVGPQDVSGLRPDNAPKWTATAIAAYDFHLEDGSTLTLRGDIRARSNVWDDIIDRDNPGKIRLRPSAFFLGGRLSWTSANEAYEISMWVRNLTQEKEILNIGPPQPNTFQLPTAFGEPRTFGATASVRF